MVSSALQTRQGFELYMNLGILTSFVGILSFFFISWAISFLLVLNGILIWICAEIRSRPPVNNPYDFLRFFRNVADRRPVLVCLGDSNTQGTSSANFTFAIVPKLCEKLKFDLPQIREAFEKPVWVVNAGYNNIPTETILNERLPYALACYPDYIMVMLGATDVAAMYSSIKKTTLMSTYGVREAPTMDTLKRNMRGIVDFIRQSSPMTQIGVCTLPPMGEDLTHPANRLVKEANVIISTIVRDFNDDRVSLIPIYEKMEEILITKPKSWTTLTPNWQQMIAANILVPIHHYMGVSYNSLSGIFNHTLLVDSFHLNENGAIIVADQVVHWLFSKNIHKAIAVKSF